jgi:hypothetical protein
MWTPNVFPGPAMNRFSGDVESPHCVSGGIVVVPVNVKPLAKLGGPE